MTVSGYSGCFDTLLRSVFENLHLGRSHIWPKNVCVQVDVNMFLLLQCPVLLVDYLAKSCRFKSYSQVGEEGNARLTDESVQCLL